MSTERRPMSKEQRAELIDAIESGTIKNATEYSRDFAARHDLNPQTVRSAISRYRRELGLLERPAKDWLSARVAAGERFTGSRNEGFPPDSNPLTRDPINAMTLLSSADVHDARSARLGAAALVRYANDEAFRQAVDEQRPEIESIYRRINELHETLENLGREEADDIIRFIGTMGEFGRID